MHTHTNGSESPAQTEGRMIRWASFYDAMVNFMTLDQIHRLRTLTVDHALLQLGEKVLYVGCGTGGVSIPAKLRIGKTGQAAGIDPAAGMIRPGTSLLDRLFRSLVLHHDHVMQFGIEDLPELFKEAGFEEI